MYFWHSLSGTRPEAANEELYTLTGAGLRFVLMCAFGGYKKIRIIGLLQDAAAAAAKKRDVGARVMQNFSVKCNISKQ